MNTTETPITNAPQNPRRRRLRRGKSGRRLGGMREVGVVGFGNRGAIESMASNAQNKTLYF